MIYLSFFLAIASEGNQTSTYTDKFGNKWRVPLNNIGKTVLDSIINYIPRIDRKFSCISPDFDLEDKEYLDSSLMYIYISVGIGLIFFTYSKYKLVLVNIFNVCGKNTIPRRGYPKYSIAKTRLTIIITAFFFEGVLFYGYFANRDLHNVINVLMKTFQSLKGEMDTNMTKYRTDVSSSVVSRKCSSIRLNSVLFGALLIGPQMSYARPSTVAAFSASAKLYASLAENVRCPP